MTLKAFMKKYGITPYLTTKVAERTKHTATEERDIDYLEQDLFASLMNVPVEQVNEYTRQTQTVNKKISDVLMIAHDSGLFN